MDRVIRMAADFEEADLLDREDVAAMSLEEAE
jgi:hypothetical protein